MILEELKAFAERLSWRTRYFKSDLNECGKCGCKTLDDLGHGVREGTITCRSCGAKYWGGWHTRAEWEKGMESDEAWGKMLERSCGR